MKKLLYILLFILFMNSVYSQDKNCFSMKCIKATANLDSIYVEYEVKNNTGTDISLLKSKYDGLRNHCWRIVIKDSLNGQLEPTFTTCGYRGDELEDYTLIKRDSVFTIGFKINTYELEIYEQSNSKKQFKPISGFNFPIKITLHYSSSGLYFKKNKYKKLLNAKFNCQSEPYYLKQ